jgi:hypothetical protein
MYANTYILQLDASGIRKWDGAKKLSSHAARFWFSGLFFNVAAGFYTLFQLRQRKAALDKTQAEKAVESKKIERYIDHIHTTRLCELIVAITGNGTQLHCN